MSDRLHDQLDVLLPIEGEAIFRWFDTHGSDPIAVETWTKYVFENVHSTDLYDADLIHGLAVARGYPPAWAHAKARMREEYWSREDRQKFEEAIQLYRKKVMGEKEDDAPIPLSDLYNARALVREHGENLRYSYEWRSWLAWVGTHWKRDLGAEVTRKAKATVRGFLNEAASIDDDAYLKTFMAHVKRSCSTAALEAMLRSAQSEEGIPVDVDDLDQNGWLLNCANGTLDLRTGEMRPHARSDYITHCLATPYDPEARCPTWDAFLDRIMEGNQSLIEFLQRAIGYALTGVIRQHVFIVLWGTGQNGKSTFLSTVHSMMESLAMKAAAELFMHSKVPRHSTERTDLFGRRLVYVIETEEGARLAENFIKEATGGDRIRARRVFENTMEFVPTHKFILATNNRPEIRGIDQGIWRRVKLVPFTVSIPAKEQDHELPDKLKAELPGILAWAVRGCMDWQRHGLPEPEEVIQATDSYRQEQDTLGVFFDECCMVGEDYYRVNATVLYEAYKKWCERTGEYCEKQKAFGGKMTDRGFNRPTINGRKFYTGIALLDPDQVEIRDDHLQSSTKRGSDRLPRSTKVDDQGDDRLPSEVIEKTNDNMGQEWSSDDGRPKIPLYTKNSSRVRIYRKNGLPSSTDDDENEIIEEKTDSYSGRRSSPGMVDDQRKLNPWATQSDMARRRDPAKPSGPDKSELDVLDDLGWP